MASCTFVVASVSALLGVCYGQTGQGLLAWTRFGQIGNALRSKPMSASILNQLTKSILNQLTKPTLRLPITPARLKLRWV
jgi:hypothetical protein